MKVDLAQSEAIFQIQNEAQGLDPQPWATNWHCARAKKMRPLMDPVPRLTLKGKRPFER
jgi:hypothetical protein